MNNNKRIEREKSLLAIALDCYASDQWESVTIATIARKAGIAKGTVYLHFSSKDEIFACLAMQFYRGLSQACDNIKAIGSKEVNTGKDQLAELIQCVFSYYRKELRYRHIVQYSQRVYFSRNLKPELAQSLISHEHELFHLIKAALLSGSQDGSLQKDAAGQANAIYCTVKGALQQCWNDESYRFCRSPDTIEHCETTAKSADKNIADADRITLNAWLPLTDPIISYTVASVSSSAVVKATTTQIKKAKTESLASRASNQVVLES